MSMLSGHTASLESPSSYYRLAHHNPSEGAGNILRASTSHAGMVRWDRRRLGIRWLSGLGSSLDEV